MMTQSFLFPPSDKTKRNVFFVVWFASIIYVLLPFLLFGHNMIITIHDNLDSTLPLMKMLHNNDLFFKFDVIGTAYNEMSTLYCSNYSFQSLLYCLFDDFVAYALGYFFSALAGFYSMWMLLKLIRLPFILSVLASFCFVILPVFPLCNIAFSILPLIIVIFYHFAFQDSDKFSWGILFLLFYPFFSSFAIIGFFILAFWLIGTIVLLLKTKKININLVIGFFLLCAGYIIVDMQLFYVMFVVSEPLNRGMIGEALSMASMLKVFLHRFMLYTVSDGYTYHATSMQSGVIVPLAAIVSLFLLFLTGRAVKRQKGKFPERIKTILARMDGKIKLLFILELLVFIFAGIAALHESGLLQAFIRKYISVLAGFNWGRVWIFNRVLWYIIFALCLYCILHIKEITLNFEMKTKLAARPSFFFKRIVYAIIGLQMIYVSFSPKTLYNDQSKTWVNEILIKTGLMEKIYHKDFYNIFSYREFFAEDLFNNIKQDISYCDEKVVAFGYHPSVLIYNGFNCIDGYLSFHPLHHMQKFRTLIAPELEINKEDRDYYNNSGGIRMYLYNSELSFKPTRNKNTSPVRLNINMDVFRNDFNGKYILSRAEILNISELGLRLKNRYYSDDSIYTIYLYEIID
jgi:hypothetical protein